MKIETVKVEDHSAVEQLLRQAFTDTPHGYDGEAELVTALRQDPKYNPKAELVAKDDNGQMIGQVLITPIIVDGPQSNSHGAALAPLAVDPQWQHKGVGKALMQAIEQAAKDLGIQFIIVMGWADYYSKFGYLPASQFNIRAPFDVPDENFMAKAITPQGLDNINGTVRYLDAFNGV
ncbi:GNAT family acetyltransferase [Lentilactobacillus senioris DSM 24302 = JCM 17472]|uniref:GNAT family acetyltransferase n=1 Tax=Lentilactobacillus senioris DSM 24302 = JCM 17472 TaxID=1423802 RepID=A0A0R2CTN3_9LACO|nr:N-acetyltransferase [Lentilactobacillus senioris]KRM94450.1 GNAT family acetyltransferase [Lentilactobacillus senioris DSM 24302 = JCM 17472]